MNIAAWRYANLPPGATGNRHASLAFARSNHFKQSDSLFLSSFFDCHLTISFLESIRDFALLYLLNNGTKLRYS